MDAPECVALEGSAGSVVWSGTHAAGAFAIPVYLDSASSALTGTYGDTSAAGDHLLEWTGTIAGFPPRELTLTESVSLDLLLVP